jgi:DNA-binding response OmpR family regulator
VLLVEDEPDLAAALARSLADEHCAVDVAHDGDDALTQARHLAYDVIVLDIMLPGVDGWEVLGTLRAEGHREPILLLTARDAVLDRVRGLDLGADDYLTKPFAVEELVARLRALVRRAADQPSPELNLIHSKGTLRIDTAAGRRDARGGGPSPGFSGAATAALARVASAGRRESRFGLGFCVPR